VILLALAAAAAAAADPRPGELKTYKDWIVGCDNLRSCQANVLMPDGADDFLPLTVARRGGPSDPALLDVPLPDGSTAGTRFTLRVDGKTIAAFASDKDGAAELPLTRPMLAVLLNGTKVDLLDAKGASVNSASLAGFAAALLCIDDKQRRVGTAGALKATGAKPDSAVPQPPSAPLIAVPPASAKPPRKLTVVQATRLIGDDAAVCEYSTHKVEPRSYRLDAGHSLVLIDYPCGNGAYNYFTGVYVLDESGPPRPAKFDLPPGMGEASTDGTGELTNGDWDPKARTLGSYEKGRGLGDCGSTESYAWDGRRFRLIEQNVMGECRGSIDYIRVWTAQAK
jgi:invasion protein IalB